MDPVSLATGRLFLLWLAHDLEELATMPGWVHPLFDKVPLLPGDIRRHGCLCEHVYLGIDLMGALVVAASIDGYRTRGRSSVYQAALYGCGMHTFSHLGSAALVRRYILGVTTALSVVPSFWIFAERMLRAYGVKACPHRWVIPAFPVIAGMILDNAYLMMIGRPREHHRDGK